MRQITLNPPVASQPAEEDLAECLFNLTISPFSNESSSSRNTKQVKQVQLIEEVSLLARQNESC